jgi:DNA-binding Xre family transcriptional regulator
MGKYLRFNLALLRAARGKLTQKDVARATGLSQKTLSALETGASKGIEFGTVAKLCDFLKCTPNDLLVLEDEIEYVVPSETSLKKADEIIARGLGKAMQAPERTPAEIWAAFDALREKMQTQSQDAANKKRRQEEPAKKCSRS